MYKLIVQITDKKDLLTFTNEYRNIDMANNAMNAIIKNGYRVHEGILDILTFYPISRIYQVDIVNLKKQK